MGQREARIYVRFDESQVKMDELRKGGAIAPPFVFLGKANLVSAVAKLGLTLLFRCLFLSENARDDRAFV